MSKNTLVPWLLSDCFFSLYKTPLKYHEIKELYEVGIKGWIRFCGELWKRLDDCGLQTGALLHQQVKQSLLKPPGGAIAQQTKKSDNK